MSTPNPQAGSPANQQTVVTKKTKLGGFIGLILLLAFFTPYVMKVPQLDITLILLGGMALAIWDFISPEK
ncbi:MAG: hypothetical protein ACO3UK_05010 [Burkholderiaceae bacterium]|jgi:hypothetical protein